jgi:hypothetical protein
VYNTILPSGDGQISGKSSYINCISVSYASVSPVNKEELFNLRHASARNVVERIFGILKRRFRILIIPPEYDMGIQARIPAALCALHNFIRHHDPSDIEDYSETDNIPGSHANTAIGDLATRAINGAERDRAHLKRDQIAKEMWDSYLAFVQEGDFEAGPLI